MAQDMIIDETNYEIGNKAMASVLLLYYHLLDEGGITNDQTVYIDPNDFNGFDFINLELKADYELNEKLSPVPQVLILDKAPVKGV